MLRAQWIAKKNLLCSLIKKVSDHYGGDDVDWLLDYAKDIIDAHPDDTINDALMCFMDLDKQLSYMPTRNVLHGTKKDQ